MDDAVAILGLGRLGRALSLALSQRGVAVRGWSRSMGAPAVGDAGTVLLTISDDALGEVAIRLAAAGDWRGRFVAHCSGRTGVEPLVPFAERGALTAALHPVMAFAGEAATDAARLPGIGWAVTAETAPARDRGFALAERLEGRPFAVHPAARALYHAALTHAINHLVTLTVQGAGLLAQAGAPDPAAVLRPAMAAALANALDRGAAAATGPVVRGDAGTIAAHVDALSGAAPEILDAYAAMTRAGVDVALAARRIDGDQAARLRRALG
jgi:predicted short-subunit dehydrogenase-like oxidoreductase (DUF2520 family)